MLVAAIQISRPGIAAPEAQRYAATLAEVSREFALDPLLLVAIVDHESRWYPHRVSPDGEDYGLGQIRARFVGACKDDPDPVGAPSDACLAVKERLLDGAYNLRRVAIALAANRELCVEKAGTAATERFVAGYQGLNDVARGRYCEPGPVTVEVMGAYRALLDRFFAAPRGRGKTAAKGRPGAPRAASASTAPAAASSSSPSPTSSSSPKPGEKGKPDAPRRP